MLPDVEDILDFWENTGLLHHMQDRYNLALILHTQAKANEMTNREHYPAFKRCSIPILIRTVKNHPDLFTGLLETEDCTDVYRLGPVPRGTDEEICVEVGKRLLEIGGSESETLYFGGIIAKNGKLYLLTHQGD